MFIFFLKNDVYFKNICFFENNKVFLYIKVYNMDTVIWKSWWPKPKNFKKFKRDGKVYCSFDIPLINDWNEDIDILNIDIPYYTDQNNYLSIDEVSIFSYIKNIIGIDIEECNTSFFIRDGAKFQFVLNIEIHRKNVKDYFENKKIRTRRNKIEKLRSIRRKRNDN